MSPFGLRILLRRKSQCEGAARAMVRSGDTELSYCPQCLHCSLSSLVHAADSIRHILLKLRGGSVEQQDGK